jgi:membrane protein
MGWVTRTVERITAWVTPIVEWVMALKPMRVFIVFGEKRGYLLSAGLAYQAVFSVFAGLWVGFSIVGLIVAGNVGLRDALIDVLTVSVPGLIATEDTAGVINPDDLLSATVFGWTGAIALIGLVFSALGWMAGARDAVRIMFDLPGSRMNYVLLRLKDAGLAVGFGVLLLISSGLSVAGTVALSSLLEWLGISDVTGSVVIGRVVTLGVMFVLDAFVLAMLYRVLAGMPIGVKRLVPGALIGAVGLGGLKVLGGALLGGASTNPLLASFAVFVGIMIWFNFVSQVILLAAMWIATGISDDGVVLDPVVEEKRLEAARVLVAAHEPEPEPEEKHPWFRRMFTRE